MSSKTSRNHDQLHKHLSRSELSDHSVRSYFTTDRPFKSNFQSSFMIDQEQAKQLQRIQIRAQGLKEKEKRERNILKKLRKIYQDQIKEFKELENVAKLALEEKQRQLQILSMENTQLKQQKIQFSNLKDENQLLRLKNQQLESQAKRLNQEANTLQQNYKSLKMQFQQQSQILDKGIKQNLIEGQASAFTLPESIQQVEKLSRQLEELRKKDVEQVLKKDEQNMKAQEQINNCTFILESLLKQIRKQQEVKQQQGYILKDKIINSQQTLTGMTDQLVKKTEQLSKALGSSDKLQQDLKEKQTQLQSLKVQIKKLKQLCESKELQIESQRHEIQIYEDSERMRFSTQSDNKQKTIKNFQKFEQRLKNLIQNKKLKEYSTAFDIFSSVATEAFRAWNLSTNSGANTGEKLIESLLKIIEGGLINLNDSFRQKSSLDVQRVQKMVGFIHNANSILKKRNQDEDYIQKDEERDIYVQNTPQRFLGSKLIDISHSRQISESSAKSNKRSILLQEDIEDAVVDDDELDRIKQQSLQQELSNMKNNQIILDSLNDGSDKADTIKDAISESSFSKSKISELSAAQQSKMYNDHKKAALLKGKLKKKKHHTKQA